MKVSPRALRRSGWLLLILACSLAFLWHYWLVPWRRLYSINWLFEHTSRGQWIEAQKRIKRFGLDHDSSIYIALYGDKKWMEWVVKTLEPRSPAGSCGDGQGHLPDAPFQITNQKPPNESDWVGWWATNKHKTQVEWIRDGFLQNGIELQRPLTTNNTVALLKVVEPSNVGYLKYNAMRWLRDSDFRPTDFDLANVAPEDREKVTKGLVKYAVWFGEFKDAPGKLPLSLLSEHSDDWMMEYEAFIDRPPYKWLLNVILFAMALGGVLLLRRAAKP